MLGIPCSVAIAQPGGPDYGWWDLGQVVTTLLHKLYPNLRAGPATVRPWIPGDVDGQTLKSHLVSNTTLSQLSHKYDLPKYLIASYAQLYNLQNGEKTSANIFEAYVAGVYYSFLNPTKTRMPTPLRTPSKSGFDEHVIKTPHSTQPTNGQALDQVESWLHPLFTPIAEWTLGQLKAEQARLEAMTAEKRGDKYLDQHAAGAMARLNEHCIVRERGIPEYISIRAGSDMWSVMCVATLKDGTRLWVALDWLGWIRGDADEVVDRSEDATRSTKKLASTVAAWKICQKLGIWADFRCWVLEFDTHG